jgi:hypothetical protein
MNINLTNVKRQVITPVVGVEVWDGRNQIYIDPSTQPAK